MLTVGWSICAFRNPPPPEELSQRSKNIFLLDINITHFTPAEQMISAVIILQPTLFVQLQEVACREHVNVSFYTV